MDQSSSGLAVISCQNVRSLATRSVGSFPAMIAELMAPIETPATQSGLNAGLRESLVDSGLVGPERTATLQHQRDAFEREVSFGDSEMRLDLNVHGLCSFASMGYGLLPPSGPASRSETDQQCE